MEETEKDCKLRIRVQEFEGFQHCSLQRLQSEAPCHSESSIFSRPTSRHAGTPHQFVHSRFYTNGELEYVLLVQELLMRMTLDSICKVGFGVEIGTLAPNLPDNQFAKAFDTANIIVTYRSLIHYGK